MSGELRVLVMTHRYPEGQVCPTRAPETVQADRPRREEGRFRYGGNVAAMRHRGVAAALAATLLFSLQGIEVTPTVADEGYRTVPAPIAAILDAPPLPAYSLAPGGAALLAATPLRYPPIADLARPMLRLAGLRIDPASDTIHHATSFSKFSLIRVADGNAIDVDLPAGAHASAPVWSPDGSHFAFYETSSGKAILEVGTTATGGVQRFDSIAVNAILGPAILWFPDGKTLLIKVPPPGRGRAPSRPTVPAGPTVQESLGKVAPAVTYEDLLGDAHDEDVFDYHAAAQYVTFDLQTRTTAPLAPTRVYRDASISPDGKFVLLDAIHRPYSYAVPYEAFPHTLAVVDRQGRTVRTVADLPLQQNATFDVVPTGPREVEWRANAPSTLVWAEAQDGGNPATPARVRDRLYAVDASAGPAATPILVASFPGRYHGAQFIADSGLALAYDYDRDTRFKRTLEIDFSTPGAEPLELSRLRDGDRYSDPGSPLTKPGPGGTRLIARDADAIFLAGDGYGPEGRKPFLDRFDLRTKAKTRLFQSGIPPLERVVALLDEHGERLLTERQSPKDPPNYFVRITGLAATADTGESAHFTAITHVTDPAPQLAALGRRVVTYKRNDGVDLSFTLYLPPGYKEGTRLPTLMWAYPYEFNDPSVASQNTNSTQTFPVVTGASPIFAALAGYAVLDNVSVPIVGDPKTVNNTFVEQLTADARAAIDKAVELGVTDPDRVAVAGHSYGAFMTANLLAHTHLFKAGIARSGAYNRSLTPFGFQSERRTYWEATDVYTKLSPFTYANQITEPLLLIHGEIDDNTGTFPIQSERMYAALKGNGGITRLVMLPFEAHGYLARESIETTIAETLAWLDRFVKNDGKKSLEASEGAAKP
jgi:dipeptidyl aminopeptidase/acylaminoacyl peptidase